MNRYTFNPDQIRQLEANLHVASAPDRTIQYKGEFKIHAVREDLAGKQTKTMETTKDGSGTIPKPSHSSLKR